jgi:hypothetical protein
MPLPIMEPTTKAVALNKPTFPENSAEESALRGGIAADCSGNAIEGDGLLVMSVQSE